MSKTEDVARLANTAAYYSRLAMEARLRCLELKDSGPWQEYLGEVRACSEYSSMARIAALFTFYERGLKEIYPI
jgi:hypothetical protein